MACAFRMTQKKYADLEKAGSALCEFCKAVRQENCNSCTLHEVLDSAWMEAAAEGVIDNWRLSEPSFWMDISFRYEMFDGGFNYANLFNAVYEASIGWVIHTTDGKTYKQSQ